MRSSLWSKIMQRTPKKLAKTLWWKSYACALTVKKVTYGVTHMSREVFFLQIAINRVENKTKKKKRDENISRWKISQISIISALRNGKLGGARAWRDFAGVWTVVGRWFRLLEKTLRRYWGKWHLAKIEVHVFGKMRLRVTYEFPLDHKLPLHFTSPQLTIAKCSLLFCNGFFKKTLNFHFINENSS